MHDVTISVWNRFWSIPLIEGLNEAGFDVLALGTTRRKPPAAATATCWSSALLTQASFRLPAIRDALTEHALRRYERFAARRALEAGCLWGWSGHHLAAFQRAKAAGLPVIVESGSTHVHWIRDVLTAEFRKRGLTFQDSLIDRLTPRVIAEYEIADWICVPNAFVAKTFVAHGVPACRLAINAYGMDFGFWSERAESGRPAEEPKFTVVFAGQFMLRKGVAYLVEAWQQAGLHDAELWIVGAVFDDARPLLDRVPGNVRVLGGKSAAELRELYASADLFILPSLEEGMARAVLEAMAAGLPVIVTEETGFGDVISDGAEGWVVPSKSSEAIADALRAAAADRDGTRKRGAAAREKAAGYTWAAYGERAGRFLRQVVAPAPQKP